MNREESVDKLLAGVSALRSDGGLPERVSGVYSDSRQVQPGGLFVAVPGVHVDGARFVPDAVERGARVVVSEHCGTGYRAGVSYVEVDDAASALGVIAANYYGNPSRALTLVGVTGTNGKTTVATLLYRLVEGLGHRAGLLSTVENRVHDEVFPATHTTPDPLALQAYLARMVAAGCSYAFMEVSSHALAQRRVAGTHFSGAIFTNLTRDHIDYHKTFAAYRDAKRLLFDGLDATSFALTNRDDANGGVMVQNTRARVVDYAMKSGARYCARLLSEELGGMELQMGSHQVWVQLLGRFNVYNLLAVYGAALELGFDEVEVLKGMSLLRSVSGRFEYMLGPGNRVVVVDYAHTPDALENVLETIHDLLPSGSRIITVFGAGGERDEGKRPTMGEVVSNLSDWVVITSDNPRGEDAQSIMDEIYAGVIAPRLPHTLMNVDRREGIRTGCMLSRPGDWVLVAGKGHETYQEVGGVRHDFDDREEVRKVLRQLEEGGEQQ